MKPIKILFVIDEMEALSAGGTERQVIHIVSVCRRAGMAPQVLVLRNTDWLTDETCGCPVMHKKVGGIASPTTFGEMVSILQFMRRERFDIVQSFFKESNVVAPVLGWLARVPVRIGSRRNQDSWMTRPFAFTQGVSNGFATRLLANSEGVKKSVMEVERAAASKVDILYNGINTSKFRPDCDMRARARQKFGFGPSDVVVGSTSNFVAVKRLDLLMEAFATASRKCAELRLLMAGDGPERPRLESLRNQFSLGGRVVFAGREDDVAGILNACDMFVLSSSHEGFSNGLLEAMATSLPCIATDVGGNREALGEAGILIPTKDVDALALEIASLARSQALRARFGHAARQRAISYFSVSKADELLVEYYVNLLRESGTLLCRETQLTTSASSAQ